MLMRTLCRKTIKKGTPNSPMNGGQGVEVSKTLFYGILVQGVKQLAIYSMTV